MRQREEIVCESRTVQELYSRELSVTELGVSERYEITVVMGGVGICRVFNEAIECKEGALFVIGRGISRGFYSVDGTGVRLLSVVFGAEALSEDEGTGDPNLSRVFCGGVPFSCSVLNSEAMGEISRICSLLQREQEEQGLDWRTAARAYLTLLRITVERYVDLADTIRGEERRKWSPALMAVSEVMRSFGDPNLTLSAVAQRLYVSPSRLSRDFLRVTGESFSDYLRRVRIREACVLLESSDMNNEEIVAHCGLRDIPGFYAAFKKQVGVTPHAYRKGKELERLGSVTDEVHCEDVADCVENGHLRRIGALVGQAIACGIPPKTVLEDGLIRGMERIGVRFKRNEVFVPEVLVAARAMNVGLEALKPFFEEKDLPTRGRVCIGTVRGDLHDIGKNLVKMMLEGKGLEVIDLGSDVAPEEFIRTAVESECRVICCSALLTTTMPVMAEVVKAAEEAGIRDRVKIMIGGAPVSEEYCREIGADAFTVDAAEAAEVAARFCLEESE